MKKIIVLLGIVLRATLCSAQNFSGGDYSGMMPNLKGLKFFYGSLIITGINIPITIINAINRPLRGNVIAKMGVGTGIAEII